MYVEKEGEKQGLNLSLLQDQINSEIKYLQKKVELEDKEIYMISKQFFRQLLELDYETTYEELLDELDKIYLNKKLKQEVQAFIMNIGQIEYSKKKFNQDELKVLLDELKRITKSLIHVNTQKGFISKLLVKLGTKKESKVITVGSITKKFEKESEKINEKTLISNMRDLLIASEKAMDEEKDEKTAKTKYAEAMKVYEKLSGKNKQLMYDEMMKTYHHLK